MRIQTISPLFHRPGLNLVVKMYQDSALTIYDKMVSQIDNKDNLFRVATEGDFGPAGAVNEANGIDYQDFDTPYFKDYNYQKRGIGWSVSTEAEESVKYGLFADRAPKMVRSINKSIEADVANFVNLSTSAGLTTPDGVAFASAAHLYDGGTFSNILAGNPGLSITSLALAIQAMMRQPSHTGDPMNIQGPFILMVPPDLADLANRLVKSQKYPTTNDNDPNWAGSMVDSVVVNPYFTSTTAWCLVVKDKSMNPMLLVNRRNLVMKEQFDIDKDADKFTATQIWVKIPRDPRGIVFSAGA